MRLIRQLCHYCAGVVLLALVATARAEEGGVGHYAPGSFASFIDALPGQPAVGVFNYFAYYNGNGNASRQLPIPDKSP